MTENKKLKCGDTEYCDECTARAKEGEMEIACLSQNAEGRCDFYMGPRETRVSPAKAY